MSKKSYVFLSLLLLFLMASCGPEEEQLLEITPDTIITMDVLDDYMFRDDVQYVDLRNHNQYFHSGFIYSFENIPFFDYLDYRAFIRDGTYEFNPDQLINEEQLTRFFDPEKAIFLTADGCIRSGYIKDALNYLGYERVYVIGAYYEYVGDYKVLGDGYYYVGSSFFGSGTDSETNITYHIYGVYEIDNHPIELHINAFDEDGISLRTEGYDELIDYDAQFTLLEEGIFQFGGNFSEIYLNVTSDDIDETRNIEGYTLGFPDGLIKAIQSLSAIR